MAREIIVLPYNKKWEEDFQLIKNLLLNIFKDLIIDIQHFGSTSIVGMSSKPIIDVMILVNDIQKVDDLNPKMKKAGYTPKGENGMPGRRYFQHFHEDEENHTQHVHVYEKNNSAFKEQLMFRDYLKVDRDAFEQYEEIKIQASKKFRYSPKEYTEAKTDCVNEIMKKARIYYSNQVTDYTL